MLALLGTSLGKYLAGGVALLIVAGGIALYVLNLRAEVSDARAQVAAKDATINELQATNQANVKALHDLQAADALAQTSLALDAIHQQTILQSVAQAQEHVAHVPVSTTCRAADARDLAALAGVRSLLSGAPADPKPDDPGPSSSGSHR